MKWYYQLAIIVLIIATVGGLAYREALIRTNPIYVRHYQKIMGKISTNEYLEKLQNYTGFGRAIDLNGEPTRKDFCQILEYLGTRLTYTQEHIIRHEDPIEILKYGKGRCGEFAIAFTALCLANAWEARLVMDMSLDSPINGLVENGGIKDGDHVWTEIWNGEKWIHIDPTEGAKWAKNNPDDLYLNPFINNFSMYEKNWKKELTEVWGIEPYFVERVEMNYQWEEN